MTADIIITALVYLMIPVLVNNYLKSFVVSKGVHIAIVIMGCMFIFFSSVKVRGFALLDATPVDGLKHERIGKDLAWQMTNDNWSEVAKFVKIGNSTYQIYNGLIYFLTGATMRAVVVINALLAFWGGLALVRLLYHTFPIFEKNIGLLLFMIFPPSTVFWCSGNLKEGLMYWAICQVFANFKPGRGASPTWRIPMFLTGIAVGAAFRPHIISMWLAGVFFAIILEKKRWHYALLGLIIFPLMISAMENQAGYDATWEDYSSHQEKIQNSYEHRDFGSNINYGERGPIFFVSGFISLFFRPFPWEVDNVRYLLSMVEAWGITLTIFFGWWRLGKQQAIEMLKVSEVRVVLVVSALFCLFFTNANNEGLLMRQKVQDFPALLTLLALPIIKKKQLKQMMMMRYSVPLRSNMDGDISAQNNEPAISFAGNDKLRNVPDFNGRNGFGKNNNF